MALMPLVPGFVILVFPFALYVHHQCWKGLEGVRSRMQAVPVPLEKGVEEMVKDSLAEAYLLAREAADVHRSAFHDHTFILVIFSLVAWVALLVLSGPYPAEWIGFAWKMGLGTLALVSFTTVGISLLRRWSNEDVAREERWAERLLAAMRGVVPEEGSAVELLLSACREVPHWLDAHRRGIWER